jgi:hypothetical protein
VGSRTKDRVSEEEVGEATLWVLAHMPGGEATQAQLRHELSGVLQLSVADRAPSKTRRGEELWEQQVRNLVSHKAVAGNIIAEGYAIYDEKTHKLRITPSGWAHLRRRGHDPNSLYNQA